MGTIVSALASGYSFEITNALRSDAKWYLGVIVVTVAGYLISIVYL